MPNAFQRIPASQITCILYLCILGLCTLSLPSTVLAQSTTLQTNPSPQQPNNTYSQNELINAGHHFFGGMTSSLSNVIEKALSKWGHPNAYILGQEAGGAFVMGLRYGEGRTYTKTNGKGERIFWQGPSIGWDAGADGSRVMMLVYNMSDIHELYRRFGGVTGSFYVVAGLGMTAYTANKPMNPKDKIVIVPIRTGVGLRAGANVGYLKLTSRPTWNPF